jgi:large subunit ribosomal protein L15
VDVVSLSALDKFDANTVVTVDLLKQHEMVRNSATVVKVLNNGELTKPLTIQVQRISKAAKSRIEELGGKVEVVG